MIFPFCKGELEGIFSRVGAAKRNPPDSFIAINGGFHPTYLLPAEKLTSFRLVRNPSAMVEKIPDMPE